MDILADFGQLDLQESLAITGLDFIGKGSGQLRVLGDSVDALFEIRLKIKDSKFLDYRFGDIDTKN